MVVILKDIIIDKNTIRDVHIKDGEIQYVDHFLWKMEISKTIIKLPQKRSTFTEDCHSSDDSNTLLRPR